MERIVQIQRRSYFDNILVYEIDNIWRGFWRYREDHRSIIYMYGRSIVFGEDYTDLEKISFR